MSFNGLKHATCNVWREGSKSANGIGESVGTWAVLLSGVSVRFQETGEEERTDDSKAIVRKGKIWFDLGVDITELDRVEIDEKNWEVLAVDPDVAGSGHHGAAELMRVA